MTRISGITPLRAFGAQPQRRKPAFVTHDNEASLCDTDHVIQARPGPCRADCCLRVDPSPLLLDSEQPGARQELSRQRWEGGKVHCCTDGSMGTIPFHLTIPFHFAGTQMSAGTSSMPGILSLFSDSGWVSSSACSDARPHCHDRLASAVSMAVSEDC